MALLHPPSPSRAKTRPFPSCVLGSQTFSTCPWVRAGLGRLGAGFRGRMVSCASGKMSSERERRGRRRRSSQSLHALVTPGQADGGAGDSGDALLAAGKTEPSLVVAVTATRDIQAPRSRRRARAWYRAAGRSSAARRSSSPRDWRRVRRAR